jgi:hypothetical protein
MSTSQNNGVGYKKPPKQGQFKKGQSGNPGGRPRPIDSAHSALAAVISRFVTVAGETGEVRVTKLEALFRKLVDNAMTGDPRSLKLLFDRLKLLEERSNYRDLLERYCREEDELGHALQSGTAAE